MKISKAIKKKRKKSRKDRIKSEASTQNIYNED